MITEDMLTYALDILIKDSDFRISGIDYNERNFGNTYIVLSSVYQLDLRFIMERGLFWCEIGKAGEWFFLEDIFTLLGLTELDSSTDFNFFIQKMAKLIRNNLNQILKLFDESGFFTTKIMIKEIATKRAKEMFGLN
jgi:hypothetical protein